MSKLVIVESPAKAKTIKNIWAATMKSSLPWAMCATCRRRACAWM